MSRKISLIKRKGAIIAVSLSALMVLVSLSVLLSPVAAANPTGTFIWGTPIDTTVTDLNPLTALNLEEDATNIMYPTEMLYQTSSGNLIPWLAQNYTVSPNGTVYTFYLVHNAVWMNGTNVVGPITANDVVFTFNVLKANSTLDAYGVDPYLKSVKAINNYTVQFVTTSPTVMMLTFLGTQTIIPSEWGTMFSNLSQIGGYTNMDIGHEIQAGPFILSSVTQSAITMTVNTHFWKGIPHIQTLIIEPFKSTSAMTLSFESGTIDAEYPAISDYAALKNAPNVVNNIYPEPWAYYLWDNTKVAPFNNTYFRQGLAYAINKTEILQKAEDGIAVPGSFGGEPATNTSWWASGLPEYHYNLTMADQSFEKAGLSINSNGFWAYPNGTVVSLKIVDPPVTDWMTAASLLANDLAQAGFQVTETVVPFGPWATDMFESNVSLASNVLSYYGATPSFDNPWYVLDDLFTPQGFWDAYTTHWSNSTVNNLLNESFTEVGNYSQMMNYLFQAQRIIAQQVPMVLIGDVGNYYAYNSKLIAGFMPTHMPIGMLNLLSIYVPGTPTTTTTTTTTTTKTSSAISPYVYVAIIVVVLIVIIVPVVYLMSHRKKTQGEQPKPPQNPPNQPEQPK